MPGGVAPLQPFLPPSGLLVCWGAGVSHPPSGEPHTLSGSSPLVQRAKKREGELDVIPLHFVGKLKNGFFTGMMAHRALCPCMCEMHSKHSWEVFRKRHIHTSPLQKMPVSPVQMEL